MSASWIACSERLPEMGVQVFTWVPEVFEGELCGRTAIKIAELTDDPGREWADDEGSNAFADVTHWMHLPEPPK